LHGDRAGGRQESRIFEAMEPYPLRDALGLARESLTVQPHREQGEGGHHRKEADTEAQND